MKRFSLIEFLIIVAIIGILASMSFAQSSDTTLPNWFPKGLNVETGLAWNPDNGDLNSYLGVNIFSIRKASMTETLVDIGAGTVVKPEQNLFLYANANLFTLANLLPNADWVVETPLKNVELKLGGGLEITQEKTTPKITCVFFEKSF